MATAPCPAEAAGTALAGPTFASHTRVVVPTPVDPALTRVIVPLELIPLELIHKQQAAPSALAAYFASNPYPF